MRREQRVNLNASTLDVIKPILRAYALGYLTHVSPRLISFLKTLCASDSRWQRQLTLLRKILNG